MKKRLCLTGLLIFAIAILPYRPARAQQHKPQWVAFVCGAVVLGVGAWICYSLYRLCQKIPPPPKPDDQQDPPPPPDPPPKPNAANAVPSQTMALDDNSGVLYWDCSTNGWTDPVSGLPVTSIMKTTLQATEDWHTWTDELSLLGYCSDSGILMVYSRSGAPVLTNYLAFGQTNVVNFNATGILAPHKFYRLKAP